MLQEVQAARSAEVRLESLAKLGKELLADLPGYEDVAARLSSALKDVEEKKRDLVESWVISSVTLIFNTILYLVFLKSYLLSKDKLFTRCLIRRSEIL